MSYREMRNFTEMMRALGYNRLISMENFRTPNFSLVTEILQWLVLRYDPNADIPYDLDTIQDRVIFIKYVTEFMATRAHLKLNPKKLYEADGHAVKELLKATTVLYKSSNSVKDTMTQSDEINADIDDSSLIFDVSTKLETLREGRQIATEMISKGAKLHDLLEKHVDLKEAITDALSKHLDIAEIEKNLGTCFKAVEISIKNLGISIENVASDEANLEAKIEKRKKELELNKKRLTSLNSVRPAYMDEYERLEEDLRILYEEYLIKFKNLAYLELVYKQYKRIDKQNAKVLGLLMKNALNKNSNLKSNENSFLKDLISEIGKDDVEEGSEDEEGEELSENNGVGTNKSVFGNVSRGGGASVKGSRFTLDRQNTVVKGRNDLMDNQSGGDFEDNDDDDDDEEDNSGESINIDEEELEGGDEFLNKVQRKNMPISLHNQYSRPKFNEKSAGNSQFKIANDHYSNLKTNNSYLTNNNKISKSNKEQLLAAEQEGEEEEEERGGGDSDISKDSDMEGIDKQHDDILIGRTNALSSFNKNPPVDSNTTKKDKTRPNFAELYNKVGLSGSTAITNNNGDIKLSGTSRGSDSVNNKTELLHQRSSVSKPMAARGTRTKPLNLPESEDDDDF